jgi:hypothetical protein
MKVTNHGLKGRQLQKEDYWQKAAAESKDMLPIHVRLLNRRLAYAKTAVTGTYGGVRGRRAASQNPPLRGGSIPRPLAAAVWLKRKAL